MSYIASLLPCFLAFWQIGDSPVAQAPSASGLPPGSYTPAQSKEHSVATSSNSGIGSVAGYGVGTAGAMKQDAGKYGKAES